MVGQSDGRSVGWSVGPSTVLIFIHLYADPVISDGQTDILYVDGANDRFIS